MRPTEKIEKFLQKASVSSNPKVNKAVLNELTEEMEKTKQTGASLNMWRIIMKSKISKLAAAAIILIAISLTVIFTDKTIPSAWAIEQTIEALEDFNSLYASGIFINENGQMANFKMWARPYSKDKSRSGNFRIEIADNEISVVSEELNKTYRYYPQKNIVNVLDGLQNSVKPFWPNGNFYHELKEKATDWSEKYETNANGNEYVAVTCSIELDRLPGRRFEFLMKFDIETKMPIKIRIKDYSKSRGMEEYQIDEIVYNASIPEGTFEFTIPQDVTVTYQK